MTAPPNASYYASPSAFPFASDPMQPVLRRMAALMPLSPAQARRVSALGDRTEAFAPGSVLLKEGDPITRPRYIVSGWVCRQRLLADGRRQILGLVLPGDGIGLCMQPRPLAVTTTVALTRVVAVDAAPLLCRGDGDVEELGDLHNLASSLDESLLLDHVVRLGRQTAYERVAHLLLELRTRLEMVGLGDSRRFPMPLTQEVLADVLGLSMVHVNRILQQLRRDRLVEIAGGQVVLHQPDQLTAIADYAPPRFSAV